MEEKIIEFIREKKYIYDKRHGAYKNQWLREKAFTELGEMLNLPAKTVKERWRTLMDKYMRNKKNLNKPSGSGASATKKWKWADSLSFLDDIGSSNSNTSGKYDIEKEQEEEEEVNLFNLMNEESFNEGQTTDSCEVSKNPAKRQRRSKDSTSEAIEAKEKEINELVEMAKKNS